MNKKLIANIYRYGKMLVIALAVGGLCYLAHTGGYAAVDSESETWMNLIVWAVIAASGLTALYALVSIFVNRAVFGETSLKYNTLFKRYSIDYADIMNIDGTKTTTRREGSFLRTVKYIYKVTTKTGTVTLNSHEFTGLAKAMTELNTVLNKDKGESTND